MTSSALFYTAQKVNLINPQKRGVTGPSPTTSWQVEKGPSHPFLDFLDPPLQTVQCSYVIQLFSVLN